MKRLLALVVALSAVALFSATLVSADCSYHKTQAAVDQTDASKNVATMADKTDTVQTAQAQPAKPAPAEKK